MTRKQIYINSIIVSNILRIFVISKLFYILRFQEREWLYRAGNGRSFWDQSFGRGLYGGRLQHREQCTECLSKTLSVSKARFAFRPARGVIPAVIARDSRNRQRVRTAGAGVGVQCNTTLASR
jgi:hypothetical protein